MSNDEPAPVLRTADSLFQEAYGHLRSVAAGYLAHESPGISLTPTDLVHEAYLKLSVQERARWAGRTQFMAVGSTAMRRLLLDHIRTRRRIKRGGGRVRVELDEHLVISREKDDDILAIDEAITKLETVDARQARIVEYRFFGGMTVEEVAQILGESKRSIELEWKMIRAWLRRELMMQDSE